MRLLLRLILLASLGPLLATLPQAAEVTPLAGGDAAQGEALYGRCKACHALARDRVGPRHCGLIGRQAGGLPDFHYSAALRRADFIWTPETLDLFLADPRGFLPGTSMTYAGIKSTSERADLIAFLVAAGQDPTLCPP